MGVIEVGAEGGLACTVDEVPAILPETAIAIVFTSKTNSLMLHVEDSVVGRDECVSKDPHVGPRRLDPKHALPIYAE